jgi:hypothetical protein
MTHFPQTPPPSLDDGLKKLLAPPSKIKSWLEAITRRQKAKLAVALTLVSGLACIIFYTQKDSFNDLEKFESLKIQLQDSKASANSLSTIDTILKAHPHWLGSFKSNFLQAAIVSGKTDLLKNWKDWPSGSKLEKTAPALYSLVQIYQSNVIAISQEHWQKALEGLSNYSKRYGQIQNEIESKEKELAFILQLQTLIQRAFVLQKLDDQKSEYQAWQQLLQALDFDEKAFREGLSEIKNDLARDFFEGYQQDQASLLDYVRNRLQELTHQS